MDLQERSEEQLEDKRTPPPTAHREPVATAELREERVPRKGGGRGDFHGLEMLRTVLGIHTYRRGRVAPAEHRNTRGIHVAVVPVATLTATTITATAITVHVTSTK